jgi:hypothetical protein
MFLYFFQTQKQQYVFSDNEMEIEDDPLVDSDEIEDPESEDFVEDIVEEKTSRKKPAAAKKTVAAPKRATKSKAKQTPKDDEIEIEEIVELPVVTETSSRKRVLPQTLTQSSTARGKGTRGGKSKMTDDWD